VVENFLELGGGFFALSRSKIDLSAHIRRIEAGKISDEWNLPEFNGRGSLQCNQCGSRILRAGVPGVAEFVMLMESAVPGRQSRSSTLWA
jgi:hypothetical protein